MKTLFKILKLIGIIFLLIIPTLRVWINYESSVYQHLYYLLILVLFVMLVIKIFKNTQNKKINIYILIFIFLIILDMVCYENLSMKIEPLIHMHNKYNIPYSSMEIIETKKSNNPIVGIYQPREAIIKTDNKYISLYYGSNYTYDKEGWKDDYNTSKLLSEILNNFTSDYKYFIEYTDYYTNHSDYHILIKKTDLYKMSDVIEKLNLITKYRQDFNYSISFVNNYIYQNRPIRIPTTITTINYKNIDNYYDRNDFLSKQFLTDIQKKKIEENNFDGFEFVYYSGNDYIAIEGYVYNKN